MRGAVLEDGIELGDTGVRTKDKNRSQRLGSLRGRWKTLRAIRSRYSGIKDDEDGTLVVKVDDKDGFDTASNSRVETYEHLVVMIHGVYGAPSNWKVISRRLQRRLRGQGVLLYASKVNQYSRTFKGIDTCGRRVEEELRQLVARHHSLRRISFLGHSMGGLVSRFVAGTNFDPAGKTIFGLEACHYVAIATPHLGCHSEGEAKVPLMGWAEAVPFLGTVFNKTTKAYSLKIATALCKATGRQLFLADGSEDSKPLLVRLVEDVPSQGYFYSALAHFKTRTLYANSYGDAMVGWANASLRKESELPRGLMKAHKRKGVFRQDAVRKACWGSQQNSSADKGEPYTVDASDRDSLNEYMLSRLKSLPWCRVDVTFKGVYVPFMAHTHIQVTRKWVDSVGLSVAEHISEMVCKLEDLTTKSNDAGIEATENGGTTQSVPN